MLVGKDVDGKVVSWMETYFGDNETVIVNATRYSTTVSRQDRTNGKWETKTFFGKPPVPGVFETGSR